jgi:outer membrane biosynthesis protein TonB
MKPLSGVLLACAILAAQELTPRQLFYQDDAAPKPAPKAATKKAPPKKAAPPKAAPTESPKPVPTPEPVAIAPAPTTTHEPPRVTNAAYSAGEPRPVGLRYALVQVVNGAEQEVNPTATFRSGDQVRVKVEGNRDGYLYVIARGSSGVWKPLFPAADINNGDNRIVARRAQRLPSNTQAFTFDDQAGQEQLFVIYSAEPIKDVDALIPSLTAPAPEKKELRPGTLIMASAAPINDAFVSRLRNVYSRDLIVQTVTPSQPAAPNQPAEATVPESAVYVVSKSGGRVVADIKLEHK